MTEYSHNHDDRSKFGELIMSHLKNHGYLLTRISQDFLDSCIEKANLCGTPMDRAAKATADFMVEKCDEDGEFFIHDGADHVSSMRHVGKTAASHASVLGQFTGPSDVVDHVFSILSDPDHPNHSVADFTLHFALHLHDRGWSVEHLDPSWIHTRVFSAIKRGQIREDTIEEAAQDAIEAGGVIKFKGEVMVKITEDENGD